MDNGFYYGARASNNSLAIYDKVPIILNGSPPLTRVEARIRARVGPEQLVDQCLPMFKRFGVYLTSFPYAMLHVPNAWRAADTRGRKRFLDHVVPFRMAIDQHRVRIAVEAFAAVVVPPAFRNVDQEAFHATT